MNDELLLSGASDVYDLMPKVTLLGSEYTLRSHSDPELALYDSLAAKYKLDDVAAQAYAQQASYLRNEKVAGLGQQLEDTNKELVRLKAKENKLKKDEKKITQLKEKAETLDFELEVELSDSPLFKRAAKRLHELEPTLDALAEELLNGPGANREAEITSLLEEAERLRDIVKKERVKYLKESLTEQSAAIEAEEAIYLEFTWHLWQKQFDYAHDLTTFKKEAALEYTTVQQIVGAMGFPPPLAGISLRIERAAATAIGESDLTN